MKHHPPLQDHDLERLAHKRARAQIGWYLHASVFVAVNLALAGLAAMSGRHWVLFPTLGWALGLAIHGAAVFIRTTGLHERLVQRERERLTLQRDPW